jgi:hypothetical protein
MLPFGLFQFWDDSTHYEDSGENQVTSIARVAEKHANESVALS